MGKKNKDSFVSGLNNIKANKIPAKAPEAPKEAKSSFFLFFNSVIK